MPYLRTILLRLTALLSTLALAQDSPRTTQLQVFTPFTTGGLSVEMAVTERVRGSCFAPSAADPARPDAWRCTVGNAVQDPCFANLEQTRLACAEDPFSADALLLTLAKDLPADTSTQGLDFRAAPWALELANGQRCTPLTGATAPVAGMRVNYGCGEDVYVVGPVDRSRHLWRVFYGTADQSLSLQQVTVTATWY